AFQRALRHRTIFPFCPGELPVLERTLVADAFRRNVDTRSIGLVGLESPVEARAVLPDIDTLAVEAAIDEVTDERIGSLGFAVAVRRLVLLVASTLVVADEVSTFDSAVVRQRTGRNEQHPEQAPGCPYLALHGASDRIDDGLWYAGEMPSSRIPMDSTCEIIGLKDEDARHAAGHRASSLRSSGSRVSARDPVAQLLACVIVGKVRADRTLFRDLLRASVELQDVHAGAIAVDDIDIPAIVDLDVVGHVAVSVR